MNRQIAPNQSGRVLCGTLLLAVITPALVAGGAGTDEQATGLIRTLAPDYQPWFTPLFGSPESGMESWLFAVQAALGIGVIAYYLVVKRRARVGKRGDTRAA